VWKYINDTVQYQCYCSFSGCKCGNPAQNSTGSQPYSQETFVMVIIPVFFALGFMCCAGFVFSNRERIAWISGRV